jgi:hypothetical protein
MATARITQPQAELEDEVAWVVVVVTGWVVVVVVAWWVVVVVGASVVEVVVAVVGGTVVVVVVVGGAVVVVAGAEVVVVAGCAPAPPADRPSVKETAARRERPASILVGRSMVDQPRDRGHAKRGS